MPHQANEVVTWAVQSETAGMPATLFAKANQFFAVTTVLCERAEEATLLPMGTTLGEQLLGLAALKWLMQRGHTNPAYRQFFQARVVMNQFVKEVILANDVVSLRAEFRADAHDADAVADAFELYVFALHHFAKLSLDDVCVTLAPYFEWVERAVQMDDETVSRVFVGGAPAALTFESLARQTLRTGREAEMGEAEGPCLNIPREAKSYEGSSPSTVCPSPAESDEKCSDSSEIIESSEATRRREVALAEARAALAAENVFAEASLPPTARALRLGYRSARDHVVPDPVTFEWVTRQGNAQSVSFFYCCGQLAAVDPTAEEEMPSYFSGRECWCEASLASRVHTQAPLMMRLSRRQARLGAAIAEWPCCSAVVRAQPQSFSVFPTLETNPCTHNSQV